MARPAYFNVEYKVKKYIFYKNEQNRVYVPDTKEEFEEFISALYKFIKEPTQEQTKNYNLILQYPFLLPKNRWDKGLSIDKVTGFDFTWTEIDSMPSGWYIAFGEKILSELKSAILESKEELLYQYMITDIKEKYGTLRWYDNGNTRSGYDVISKYSRLSEDTCIKCGEPATHMTEGWIMPLCDECDDKKKEKI